MTAAPVVWKARSPKVGFEEALRNTTIWVRAADDGDPQEPLSPMSCNRGQA